MDAVQLYTTEVCEMCPLPPDPSDPGLNGMRMRHTHQALLCLHTCVSMRKDALRQQQDWAARYSGIMAAATAAAAAAAPARPGLPPIGGVLHTLGPGLIPAQLAYLAIEFLAVMGFAGDDMVSAVIALSHVTMLLAFATLLEQEAPAGSAADRSERQRHAAGCLEYVWGNLGKLLLRASGVAEVDMEGNGEGSQPAAQILNNCTISRGGVEMAVPADAVARMRVVWSQYSGCVLFALKHYQGTSSTACN
jgi:hypothetical protein